EEVLDKNALDLAEGGSAIPYWDEDPHIRREYEETLQREGVSFRMEERFYRRPEEAWGAGAGEPR
ncbi:MAG: hypothetical protein QN116_00425, partial [Armatimonadota bacterium]|nr:hypothetical protein [Armatimonadota bacterium]